jgi:hypothetical protein
MGPVLIPATYSPFRLDLLAAIFPIAAAGLACCAVTWVSGHVLLSRFGRIRLRRLDDRGGSELEFALAFPVFLVSVLTTVQVALMVNAALIVDYAAFCAARSAAVWLPQENGDEAAGSITDPQLRDSEKGKRIRRAATFSCAPISPRLSQFAFGFLPGSPPADIPALKDLATALGGQAAGGPISPTATGPINPAAAVGPADLVKLTRDVLDKWAYSELFTEVELRDTTGEAGTAFPPDSPITARVTYRFYVNVPLAGPVLGALFGDRFVAFIGPYYIPISASYTLLQAHS